MAKKNRDARNRKIIKWIWRSKSKRESIYFTKFF